ncbi:hypothetical protein K7H22_19550 [Seohaeicola saemankumensis]|uniref:hypothetical protein n=1 Tax=Seohaeicola saemankumensis TaxID=481181 RepID=UPI001E3F1059|nr:hypothetical protein [Seohaeicola saemankumensis]MCD1628186.1 hypothetical protein [Seohaeicola saemankumensis]
MSIVRRDAFVRRLLPDLEISGENAFIDRIQLDVGNWALVGEEDQVLDALSQLREIEVYSSDGEPVSLFNSRVLQRVSDARDLRFRTTTDSDALNRTSPLLAGRINTASWRSQTVSRRPNEVARLVFETHLNLTRFVQAQQLKRITHLARPALATDYVLAIRPEDEWYADELPLRPATNIIIGPNKKYAFALRHPRTQQARTYFTLALGTLSRALEISFAGTGASYEYLPHLNLREIEFYWEFDSDNPVEWVLSMTEVVAQHGVRYGEVMYETQRSSIETQNQSPCLRIGLTRDIDIKIYAKTTRRVRFEVTLSGAAIYNHGGRRTHTTVEGVVGLIPALANEAASRIRPLLQSIAADPPPPGSFTALNLMHLITRASSDPHAAEAIIASLVTFGRVSPYRNDPILNAVHMLRDQGVLRNLGARSRIYIVTDAYRDALANLRRYR